MKLSFSSILNFIRLIGFFFLGVTLVVYLVWAFKPSLIDQIGRMVIRAYERDSRYDLIEAKNTLQLDLNSGIIQLEQILVDLKTVRRGDRLGSRKVQVFELLVSAQERNGDYEKALATAEKWVEFDGRDILGQLYLARLLLKREESYKQGMQILERLHKLAPSMPLVANLYSEVLLSEGKLVEAFLVIQSLQSPDTSIRDMKWEVFWDSGEGFKSTQREQVYPNISPDSAMTINFSVPSSARAIRLDPPPNQPLVIENPLLLVDSNSRRTEIELWTIPLRFNQMSQIGNILTTTGESDPFFFWDISPISNEFPADYVFSAYVESSIPDLVHDLLNHPEANSLEPLLESLGEFEALDRLASIRRTITRLNVSENQIKRIEMLNSLRRGYIEVFWRRKPAQFNQGNKLRSPFKVFTDGSHGTFDFTFQIDSLVSELRIDFPEVEGVEYWIEGVDIFTEGRYESINFDRLEATALHGLMKVGTKFTSVGPDPYFSFGGEFGLVNIMRIWGRVRL